MSHDLERVQHLVGLQLKIIEGNETLRPGIVDTPKRVAKAMVNEWFGGYDVDIAGLMKTFTDESDGGIEDYDDMVIVKDIPINSKCEHHMADIYGTATIAYIPSGKLLGLSKFARVADAFARRLQVQERLTMNIADAFMEHLQPKGVAVFLNCGHRCMESRGVCIQGSRTVTIALRGVFKEEPATKAEFLSRCK